MLNLFVLLFPGKTKGDGWSSDTDRARPSLSQGHLRYRNGKVWSPNATRSSLQWWEGVNWEAPMPVPLPGLSAEYRQSKSEMDIQTVAWTNQSVSARKY